MTRSIPTLVLLTLTAAISLHCLADETDQSQTGTPSVSAQTERSRDGFVRPDRVPGERQGPPAARELTPEQRERMQNFRQMPQEQRQQLRDRFQNMNPQQRQQMIGRRNQTAS